MSFGVDGGAERRVKCADLVARTPIIPAEIGNCNYIHDPNQSPSMRKVRSFIPHGTILRLIFRLRMTDSNYVNKRTIHPRPVVPHWECSSVTS